MNDDALEKKGSSATKKAKIALLLSIPGVVFGLLAWIGFVMGIVSIVEMKSTGDSTKKGQAITAIVIGGFFGPVRSALNYLATLIGPQ